MSVSHTVHPMEQDVKPQLLDKALVFLCDRLREGTTLARCYEVWETWAFRGVAESKADWFDALGAAFRHIERAIGVSATACTAGSWGMAELTAALLSTETELEVAA